MFNEVSIAPKSPFEYVAVGVIAIANDVLRRPCDCHVTSSVLNNSSAESQKKKEAQRRCEFQAIVESKRQRISSPMHEGFHAEAEALLSCAKRLRS